MLHSIHMCPHQEGKSVQELQTQLCGLSEKAIKEAIDYLATEGRIYPTVDKEHFKSIKAAKASYCLKMFASGCELF